MEQQFRKVTYVNPKRRSLYTTPTWTYEPEYIDPKYMPVIFNERSKSYNTYNNSSERSNTYSRPIISHNRQTQLINSAQVERDIDEGIFDRVDQDFVNTVIQARLNVKSKEGQSMTQKELANKCNISVGIIQAFEAGQHILSQVDKVKITKTLNIR